MSLSRGLVLHVVCVVFGSIFCPENCKVIEDSAHSTCDLGTLTCSHGCTAGYYGNTCYKRCDVNCEQGACQRRDGTCICVIGYTFNAGVCSSSSGVKCISNDHCLNNTCLSVTRDDCFEGCKPGWYGKFCQKECYSQCVCDELTGSCTSCIPGWYGAECRSSCSPDCVDSNCHRNGTCVDGCITGSYGETCREKCSPQCLSGCDQLTGDCVECESGRYGLTCQSECSYGCAGHNNDCDRDGNCIIGCMKGHYGEKCVSNCPQQCHGNLCDINGSCSACKKGFFGPSCQQVCLRCTDGICNQITGGCTKGCDSGYYGSFCHLPCDNCNGAHCDRKSGECIDKGWHYWLGGGVSVIIMVFAAGLIYMSYRFKRMHGVIYNSMKWRRRPPSTVQDVGSPADSEHDDQVITIPPTVCPIRPFRETSYIRPRHTSTDNLQVQLQVDEVLDYKIEEEQAEVTSSENRSSLDRLQHDDHGETVSDRPDSYMMPQYWVLNEDMMATPPQPARGAKACASDLKKSPISVVADVHENSYYKEHAGDDFNIPLLAECFGTTGSEDSPPGNDSRPDVENYNHPFRDHYTF